MCKTVKAPTSYTQQVALIKKKGIDVSDPSACESLLAKINYYRFSGYFLPFINKSTEQCHTSVTFEQIRDIYTFDTELRNLISLTIERIEIFVRSSLSYYNAHHYGAEGYMYSSNFNSGHDHISFVSKINSCINDNRKSLVVQHHQNIYGGHFPIWVIIDFFSLGMLSYFFTDMKNPDKASIASDLYGVNYQTLSSWLRCITDLRNRCAHYSRLYYWIFPAIPKIPATYGFSSDRTLFSQLYMLKLMYPYPDRWNDDFVKPLKKLMSKYNNSVSRKHLGFPYRWKSMLTRA